MSQVLFTRWATDPASRTQVAVNPKRVDCVEFIYPAGPARAAVWTNDAKYKFDDVIEVPAATRIVMQGKQEYWVQGTVAEVTARLNKRSLRDQLDELSLKELDDLGVLLQE